MKAARYHGDGRLVVGNVRDPVLGDDDVIIAPEVVGVCGTDVHIVDGEFPTNPPVTLGHEVCGRVVAIGARVDSLAVGDLVTVEPHRYCGVCRYCRAGQEHLCTHKKAFGVHLDGGMAELMTAPARICYLVPAGVPPEIAAYAEPVGCCIHGLDRLSPTSGSTVLICGAGPAGAILTALAHRSGARVAVSDPHPSRRDLALAMGADWVLDSRSPGFVREALDISQGGFSYLVEAAGRAEALETLFDVAARGARILVFGVAAPTARARVSPYDVYARELTLLGSAINPFTHQRATAMLPSLPLGEISTLSYELNDAPAAIEASRHRLADKVQIRRT